MIFFAIDQYFNVCFNTSKVEALIEAEDVYTRLIVVRNATTLY